MSSRFPLHRRIVSAVLAALACIAVERFQWSDPLDHVTYDILIRGFKLPPPPDALLVAIDDLSLAELGRWPWPRERHVDFLRKVTDAGAAVVALDVIFAERDVEYPEVDLLLAEALAQNGRVVLPIYFDRLGRDFGLRVVPPVAPLAESALALGHVHVDIQSDGAVRGIYGYEGLGGQYWRHFALVVEHIQEELKAGRTLGRAVLQQRLLTEEPRHREYLNVPLMGPADTMPQVSYVDVVRGRVAPDELAGKVLFVGATGAGLGDSVVTSLGRMSGIEFNANVYNASRRSELIRTLSQGLSNAAGAIVTFALFMLLTSVPPRTQLWVLCTLLAGVVLTSLVMLRMWNLWFSPLHIIFGLLVGYPVWSWMRLSSALSLIQSQLRALDVPHATREESPFWAVVSVRARMLAEAGYIASWHIEQVASSTRWRKGQPRWQHSDGESVGVLHGDGQVQCLRLNWRDAQYRPLRPVERLFWVDEVPSHDTADDSTDLTVARFQRAFEHAREFRELVDSAIENLTAGIIITDIAGEILFFNTEARHLLPMTRTGLSVFFLLAGLKLDDGEELASLVRELALNDKPFEVEARIPEVQRDVLLRGRAIDMSLAVMVFVLADTTEIKLSERSRLEAINFLSHDLRAPLNSVISLLEAERDSDSSGISAALAHRIGEHVRTTLGYAENFVQLSRLKHNSELQMEACEGRSIIDDAASLVYRSASQKGVALEFDYPENDVWLWCNRSLVERACLNLIENAIKYSDGGRVMVSLGRDRDCGLIEVQDEGVGIDASRIDSVFELFQQGSTPRGGVGLGLRFVAAVADSHDGSIDVRSFAGEGSRFSLRIPLAEESLALG